MLMEQTIEKLNYMKLFGMVKGVEEQATTTDALSLSFEERLSFLVDREFIEREDKKIKRLLRAAKLKSFGALEDLDYSATRGLDRAQIAALSSFDWLERHHNIIICGATGTGKTYLSCAFGSGACRKGFKTCYYRLPRLLLEVRIARADGTYIRLLSKIGKSRLLIIDDFGLQTLSESEARDLLEVIEECQGRCSLIIAGQLPTKKWHETIANPTIADAILDRLVHSAYKFNLKGESMRKIYAKLEAKPATL